MLITVLVMLAFLVIKEYYSEPILGLAMFFAIIIALVIDVFILHFAENIDKLESRIKTLEDELYYLKRKLYKHGIQL